MTSVQFASLLLLLLAVAVAMVESRAAVAMVESRAAASESSSTGSRGSATTHPIDIDALQKIKAGIDPTTIPQGSCLQTWDFSVDPCQSRFRQHFTCGIDCEEEQGEGSGFTAVDVRSRGGGELSTAGRRKYQRVVRLVLDGAGYGGFLSPYVGNLTSLSILQLSGGNSIAGNIPETIARLSRLTQLDLSGNRFDGQLPEPVAGNLTLLSALDLSGNKLTGCLPESINRLASLTDLRIQNNFFAGSLPDLRPMGQLRQLDASGNALSGGFPASLPESLSSLTLRNNNFAGNLPKTIISAMTRLTVLDLSQNQFTGCITDAILAHQSLQQLNLSSNKFSQIRAHAKHIRRSSLVALDLSYNLITGPLPSFFALMTQLSALSLRYNFFHGAIPQSYGAKAMANGVQAKPLQRLLLDGNYLTGPLPAPLIDGMVRDRPISVSVGDNCFQDCSQHYAFCQGKNQKTETLCRLFNTSP